MLGSIGNQILSHTLRQVYYHNGIILITPSSLGVKLHSFDKTRASVLNIPGYLPPLPLLRPGMIYMGLFFPHKKEAIALIAIWCCCPEMPCTVALHRIMTKLTLAIGYLMLSGITIAAKHPSYGIIQQKHTPITCRIGEGE